MQFAAFLVLLSVALPVMTAAAAVIDDGFAQDGTTTYCQGIHTKQDNPLVFDQLQSSSAGSCPIAVEIQVPSTTIAPLATLDVAWSASLYTGVMTKNLFPDAVNELTKQANPVLSSLLRACKSGTNCATSSVIYPATVPGDPSTDAGPFDASGKKQLQRFKFQFPTAGDDYVLVGKVVLKGDPKLDISATEFIAFQRIHVGTEDPTTTSPPPASVKPANISTETSSPSNRTVVPAASPSIVSAAAPGDSTTAKTSTPADKDVSASSGGGGVDMETVSIVGVIGIVIIVIVLGYSFVVHREKSKLIALRQNQTNPSPTLSFESQTLHNNNNNGGDPAYAFAAPARSTTTVRKSVAPPPLHYEMENNPMAQSVRKVSRDRAPPPPRPSQPLPPWLKASEPLPAPAPPSRQASVSSAVTLEYSNSGHSDDSVFSLGDATNMSSFEPSNPMVESSVDDLEEFRDHRHSSVALLESSPVGSEISDVSSLGSLHDSGDHLEPIPRRTFFSIDDSSRDSSSVMMESSSYRASSSYRVSSYRESSSYREDGQSAFYRPSSRLFSETVLTVHSPRSGSSIYYPRDTSEYNAPYTDRNSESDEWVRRTTDGHYML